MAWKQDCEIAKHATGKKYFQKQDSIFDDFRSDSIIVKSIRTLRFCCPNSCDCWYVKQLVKFVVFSASEVDASLINFLGAMCYSFRLTDLRRMNIAVFQYSIITAYFSFKWAFQSVIDKMRNVWELSIVVFLNNSSVIHDELKLFQTILQERLIWRDEEAASCSRAVTFLTINIHSILVTSSRRFSVLIGLHWRSYCMLWWW